jgi:formiminoglutamase
MKKTKDYFNFFNENIRDELIKSRNGETKLGEKLNFITSFNSLKQTNAKYVIIGVPEDIGVRANHGKPGAADFWFDFIAAFINLQENRYLSANDFLIAGHIKTQQLITQAQQSIDEYKDQLGRLSVYVETIDEWLSGLVKRVKEAGKIPVVIGGGHNNAYGMIKGASMFHKNPINVLNFDAHTDLRWLEYRHSGNGFSYALDHGFLKKYSIVGVDKAYTPEYIYEFIDQSDDIKCLFSDDIYRLSHRELIDQLKSETERLKSFGLEIDMDCVQHQPASALNPLGFTPQQLSAVLGKINPENLEYLHICEAHKKDGFASAKLVSHLIFSIFTGKFY